MDKKTFIDALIAENAICPKFNHDIYERKMFVTVNSAYYGNPSAAIIAFEGSPPRCQIFVELTNEYDRHLIISRSVFRRGKRKERILAIVDEFLKEYLAKQLRP